MDKNKILSQLISEQEIKYEQLITETKNIIERVNESPSATESHSDTSRSQNSWVADGISMKANELQIQILKAKNYHLNNLEGKISVGSLIDLNVNNASGWYFILPFFGGQISQIESNKIAVISAQSPIAQKVLGQQKGYEFSFANKNYIVKDVK
jgi:hypothetical protein